MIAAARLTPGPGFRPINALSYYAMRLLPQATARRVIARGAASVVALLHPLRSLRAAAPPNGELCADEVVAGLRAEGCTTVEPMLTAAQIAEIHAFLRGKPVVASKGATYTLETVPDDVRRASYPLDVVLSAPHIVAMMNSKDVLDVAGRYLDCKPTISAVGLHWSLPSKTGECAVQVFHRDPDDWRFLKLFVYLTDVDEGAGPHEYVRGSHVHSGRLRSSRYADEEVLSRYGQTSLERVLGPAGTTFIADTWGIHKGRVAQTRPRLIFQVTYSILPVLKFEYRPVALPARSDIDSYTNRLLVAER